MFACLVPNATSADRQKLGSDCLIELTGIFSIKFCVRILSAGISLDSSHLYNQLEFSPEFASSKTYSHLWASKSFTKTETKIAGT